MKVAFVTGSTSGIGLAIAKKFASKNYDVVINGFGTDDQIQDIKTAIKSLNKRDPIYINADLSKEDDVKNLLEDLLKHYPEGVDVLVNNAGITCIDYLLDAKLEDFDRQYAIMVKAPFLLCKALVPVMKRNKKAGRIINIASINGLSAPQPLFGGYIAAKHAIVGLTKTLALEVARENITCNAICPGGTKTPLVEDQLKTIAERRNMTVEDAYSEWESDFIPVGKAAEPSEIAELAWYLAKPEARFVTGSIIPIDGGYMAQ